MEMSDHCADLAASSNWANCTDCNTWMPRLQLTETVEHEPICIPCLVVRYCIMLIGYEEKALSVDDPKGSCAAHHRGAIGAYKRILQVIHERQ